MQKTTTGKVLRIIAVVLLGLTAAVTLMGGIGTTCVALNPTGYGEKFAGIAPFQWLYIFYVLVTVGIGVLMVRAVVLLSSGARQAYRCSLVALVAGVVVGVIHILTSRALRGGSMPVDGVVYVTLLTLVIFLLFRIPTIWQAFYYEKPGQDEKINKTGMAIALLLTGGLTLTIQFLMAPTHTIGGINYADVWHATLSVLGVLQILVAGVVGLVKPSDLRSLEIQKKTNP